MLGLPASAMDGDPVTLRVGETVSFGDRMGPLVVNEDGTTAMITNWAQMAGMLTVWNGIHYDCNKGEP